MFGADSPNWIAVVVASVYLLQNATKDLSVCRWLSSFSLGWIIAGLTFLYPLVLKGSWIAIGTAYLLMGVLIVNTLILSAASTMPDPVISYKSQELEKIGLIFTGFVLAGFAVLLRDCVIGLKQLINAKLQGQAGILVAWRSA